MTTAEKVIKTKVGLLELGKQLGNVSSNGVQPRQFLPIQRALRDGRRSSAARNFAKQAEPKESDNRKG
jgi:hypothetical protein